MEERQQIEVEEESLIEAVRRATTLSAVCSARRKWCSPPSPARDFDGAHDIAQETFLRAWFGIAGLQGASSFAAWLRSIARTVPGSGSSVVSASRCGRTWNWTGSPQCGFARAHAEKSERRRR